MKQSILGGQEVKGQGRRKTCSTVMSHLTHYRSFRGRSYRSDDRTNSITALKDNG